MTRGKQLGGNKTRTRPTHRDSGALSTVRSASPTKPAWDQWCTITIRIAHDEGGGSTETAYVVPTRQLGEALFELLMNQARRLSAAANEFNQADSYHLINPPPVKPRGDAE